MWRVPLGHPPRNPVAHAHGPRDTHDLDAFAQLIRQLAAPPLMDDEPLPNSDSSETWSHVSCGLMGTSADSSTEAIA